MAFIPMGAGTNDFANPNNHDGCLSGEHQSLWYYFAFAEDMPPNSSLEFTISPNAGPGQDYDFAVFGPDVDCDSLGFPIRCSWAAANCAFCPLTGLGMGATDVSEGANGDGFVAPLVVQPGQGYYLLIDNWLTSSSGFTLTWGGSAAAYLDCEANPVCEIEADAGPGQSACSGSTLQLTGSASGATGTITYAWSGSGGSTAYLDDPNSPTPQLVLPLSFSGTLIFTLTVSKGNCSDEDTVEIVATPRPVPEIMGSFQFCPGQFTLLATNPGFATYQWSNGATGESALFMDPGIASVTVTDAQGCEGTAGAVTSLLPQPEAAIDGTLSVCEGGVTELDAGPGFSSYLWSDGSAAQILAVAQPGQYSVTVSNAEGCLDSALVAVQSAPGPEPSIAGPAQACPAQAIALDAGAGWATYHWSDNSSGPTLAAAGPGLYALTVTDADGCLGYDSLLVEAAPPLAPAIAGPDAFCPGASLTLDAGPGYASYLWSNDEQSQTISISNPGQYSVTVVDANSCSGEAAVAITQLDAPVPQITGALSACPGETTELAATPGFSAYLWSDGSTGPSIQASPGAYSVIVTDSNGCAGTAAVDVALAPAPTPQIVGDTLLCPGGQTTLGLLTPYASYQWSNGEEAAEITAAQPGLYAVTVTNAFGCQGVAQATVQVALPIEVEIAGPDGLCPDSVATLEADPGYASYLWSNGISNQSIAISAAGAYAVTVADAQGCNGIASIQIEQFDSPTPAIAGGGQACPGDTVTLSAGQSYTTYTWSNGAVAAQIEVAESGTYGLTVTNADGCPAAAETLVEIVAPLEVAIQGQLAFCAGDSTLLSAGPGFDDYQWSDGTSGPNLNVTAPGLYRVTASYGPGCTAEAEALVSVIALPQPQVVGLLAFCEGGMTNLGLSQPYAAYSWSDGSAGPSLEVSLAGEISVTVTDGNGCSAADTVLVQQLQSLEPQILGELSFCAGGSTLLQGEAGYVSYSWSNGASGPAVTVDAPGLLSLEVEDANGCTGSTMVSLTEHPLPQPEISGDTSFCVGASTLLDAGSGYSSYLWPDGQTSQTATIATAGSIALTVVDSNGCSGTAAAELVALPLPEPAIGGSSSFCPGGFATLSALGQYASYQWSEGSIAPSIQVDAPGVYGLTVTDADGCVGTAEIEVTEEDQLSPVIAGELEYCAGDSTLLDAGAGYATYAWSDGSQEQILAADQPGVYRVLVTDFAGCSGEAEVTVIENPLPQPAIEGSAFFCAGDSAVLAVSPGFASYQWSTGALAEEIAVSQAGQYEVTVTDANGCQARAMAELTERPLPDFAIAGQPFFCAGETTALSVAPAAFAQYEWSDGNGTPTITADQAQEYSVTVTDAFGCQAARALQVEAIPLPIADAGAGGAITCTDTAFTLGGSGSSQGNAFAYLWNGPGIDPAQAQSPFPTVGIAGIYSLIVRDTVHGCASLPVEAEVLDQREEIAISLAVSGVLDCRVQTVIIDASGSQNGAGIVYVWQDSAGGSIPGADGMILETDAPGVYSLLVLDTTTGCRAFDSIMVEADRQPPVADAGEPQQLDCRTTQALLDGSASSVGPSIVYSWTATDGQILAGADTPNPLVGQPGLYQLRVLDERNGCADTAQVQVEQDLEQPMANAGPARELDCDSPAATLDGSGSSGSDLVFEWSFSGDPAFYQTGSSISVSAPGIYTLLVTNASNGCADSATVAVIENQRGIEGLELLVRHPVCRGDGRGLIAIERVTGGSPPFMFSLDGAPFTSFSDFPNLPGGNHRLVVQDAAGCEFDTAIVIRPGNDLQLSLGEDRYIQAGQSVTLRASVSIPLADIASLLWSSKDSLPCYDCFEIELSPMRTMVIRAVVTDENGCTAEDEMTIFVEQFYHAFIPNAFSPNGDGINDMFMIFAGSDVRKVRTFMIFDRWGEKVFEDADFLPNDPVHGWDGTFRNSRLSPAVFVYFAELEFIDGEVRVFEGEVTLVR